MGSIDRIKTPSNHAKIEICAPESIIHSLHAVLWSMDHKKGHSNTFR